MAWLRRLGGPPPAPAPAPPPALVEEVPWSLERATPGVAALFDGVTEDQSHSVLDLGTAAHSSLGVYSRFARRIRFADLLDEASAGKRWTAALDLPAQPDRPYDLILTWDLLDRLFPEDRPRLMERVNQISAGNARLHVLVDSSDRVETEPLRYTLMDTDRVRYEPTGPARPVKRRLLPAEVEQLLHPFTVIRAFTLKGGFREYVAARGRV